ncbi:MAG: sulfurtransferase TusA family protein [Desulfomonile sp.]|nr:sulfurtransferase TusA family protein [Desulfomonile sp.]
MTEKVDARGLSCPQPVLMTLAKMREMKTGELEVFVDNEVSKENVSRAAAHEGWEITEAHHEAEEYRLLLRRS